MLRCRLQLRASAAAAAAAAAEAAEAAAAAAVAAEAAVLVVVVVTPTWLPFALILIQLVRSSMYVVGHCVIPIILPASGVGVVAHQVVT